VLLRVLRPCDAIEQERKLGEQVRVAREEHGHLRLDILHHLCVVHGLQRWRAAGARPQLV
jgi:hypothetical protein